MLGEPAARFLGWRMFSGLSITGKELHDSMCPMCSGRGQNLEDHDWENHSWDIRCLTCTWLFSDEWVPGFIPLLTATEAWDYSLVHHDCDPDENGMVPESVFQYMNPLGKWFNQGDKEFTLQIGFV